MQPLKPAVAITGGSFAWSDKQPTPTLSNINLSIPRGKLVAIVGQVRRLRRCGCAATAAQVGSGKSSLISAVLGQMSKLEGRVETVDSIAYVPQQAWIQNASVKNNVLFGQGMDWARYNEIVRGAGCGVMCVSMRRCRRVRWMRIWRFCRAATRRRLGRRAST